MKIPSFIYHPHCTMYIPWLCLCEIPIFPKGAHLMLNKNIQCNFCKGIGYLGATRSGMAASVPTSSCTQEQPEKTSNLSHFSKLIQTTNPYAVISLHLTLVTSLNLSILLNKPYYILTSNLSRTFKLIQITHQTLFYPNT